MQRVNHGSTSQGAGRPPRPVTLRGVVSGGLKLLGRELDYGETFETLVPFGEFSITGIRQQDLEKGLQVLVKCPLLCLSSRSSTNQLG